MGVADALTGGGFWPRHFDAAQGIPHAVAFDRFPDAVQCVPRCVAQLFHAGDACGTQTLQHTAADASDVFELEAVEDFRQVVEIERHQAVGLFELAGELGKEAVGREADRGADIWTDLGFEGGFDLKGLGTRDRGRLPVGRQTAKHLVDREHGIDVNDLVNDLADLVVRLDVAAVVALYKLDARAEEACLAHSCASLNAACLRLVAGSDTASRVNTQ